VATLVAWRICIAALPAVLVVGCARRPQEPSAPGTPDMAGLRSRSTEPLTRHELAQLIDGSPLARVADDLKGLIRDAVTIELRAVTEDSLELGASKIGGAPDLPEGTEWPRWQDVPLGFIAQFRLADVAEYGAEGELPASGMLHFFYDARPQTWASDAGAGESWRVLYHEGETTSLIRAAAPADLPEESRFPACELSFASAADLPPWESADMQQLGLTSEEADWHLELMEQLPGEQGAGSKLLGHPDTIQGDMQAECQLASTGASLDPEAFELPPGATDWRLLLQVDSEDEAGMMWGDSGMLYYWIRQQDLQARNFDDVWLALQCY
jgi:uncharacterized protein YwqG